MDTCSSWVIATDPGFFAGILLPALGTGTLAFARDARPTLDADIAMARKEFFTKRQAVHSAWCRCSGSTRMRNRGTKKQREAMVRWQTSTHGTLNTLTLTSI